MDSSNETIIEIVFVYETINNTESCDKLAHQEYRLKLLAGAKHIEKLQIRH